MKLRRIEISGFKSFIDRTVLLVDDQLTAVVGPNGCGKSNIVDAIRWAMGEQSAKALRGKAMDEVIFSGSESRPHANSAEVVLTFENSSGTGHPNYAAIAEIAVGRRITREGGSEYSINGSPCRRRDVTELLLAAGVSPRSSMVEQGRMGLIVTARPEERRLLIEEAAGIAKYRLHRQATQRKMEHVRQNLLRVSDVTAEMKRSLNSLKRQAGKARRFKAFREELTHLELLVASHTYLRLAVIAHRQETELRAVERELEQAREALEAREQTIIERRRDQLDAESVLEKLQKNVYQNSMAVQTTEGRISNLERDLKQTRRNEQDARLRVRALGRRLDEVTSELDRDETEKAATAGKAERLVSELAKQSERLEGIRTRLSEVEKRIGGFQGVILRSSSTVAGGERSLEALERRGQEDRDRVKRLEDARSQTERHEQSLTSEIGEMSQKLEALRERAAQLGETRKSREEARRSIEGELGKAAEELERVSSELNRNRSRLQSFEEIAGRYENFGQGVRELLGRSDVRSKTLAVVAEVLDIPSNLEPAMATVLGEKLQDLVVEDLDAAVDVADLITGEQLGRAAAIPAVPRRVGLPGEAPQGEGILGYLADLVGFERKHEPLVRQLLKGIVIVEDLTTAKRLWNVHGGELTYATLAGEVVYPTGRICAGREEQGLALLQTKREIRGLQQRVEALEQDHESKAERVADLRAHRTELAKVIEDLTRDVHNGELEVMQQQKDLSQVEGDLRRARGEQERVVREVSRVSRSLDECERERVRMTDEMARAARERASAEKSLLEEQQALEKARLDEREALADYTEAKVQAASVGERVDALTANIRRLEMESKDLRRRSRRSDSDQHHAAESQGRLAGELFASREQLIREIHRSESAGHELETARAALEKLRAELAQQESEARLAQRTRDEIRDRAEKMRLDLHQIVMERTSLVQRLDETRGVDLEAVVVEYHTLPPAEPSQNKRIDELRRLIERLGQVNLTAVEEYDEIKVRYDEMTAQQEDLEGSLNHLQRAIQKLNREGRRRFRECFDEVNGHFQTVFPKLFKGGRARLELTDEKDLLETGVEIVAQPPGKKLGRMELMSGGEKALTAVSLIFAIFQASPSPFSILDEVDAPFDDANVRRFLKLLRAMAGDSQFVMVTHSKLSMAEADVLYGVTMEEPGISKIVSVRLSEIEDTAAAAA